MTRKKAIRNLGWAREDLNFWRESYADAKRSKNPTMDVKLGLYDGKTCREYRMQEARKSIEEAKARIAQLERIAL